MTFNVSQREMDVIEELAKTKSMSKTAIMRQALRLYQSIDFRIMRGERMFWKDKNGKEIVEVIYGCMGD